MNSKKMKVTFIATVIASLIIIVTLFLPFASATESNRGQLLENSEYGSLADTGLTNEDLTDVSLFEYVRVYSYLAENEYTRTVAIVCMSTIIAFAFFAVMTFLFSILKKPIAIIIFDVLAMLDFLIIRFDYSSRGVVPSQSYNWGFANYIIFIFGLLVLAGAIVMLVGKRKKKE